jgi:hypothetical protein
LHGLVEIGGGLLDLLQRKVAERAAEQRLGLLRRQAIRRREIVDRQLMLFFALIEQAAVVQGLRVVRIESDRLVELCERLLGFSGSCQRASPRVV